MTSAARITRIFLCVAVLLCFGAAAPAAQRAGAQAKPPSGLQRLWSAYPVGSKQVVSNTSAREKRRVAAATDRSSSTLTPVVLGFATALVAAGMLAAFLVLRPRLALGGRRARTPSSPSPLPEGPRMNDFRSRLFKTSDEQTPEERPPIPPPERAQPAQPAPVPTSQRDPDPDQASIEVGDQVATILASAKQAAHRLQISARQDAERIRDTAKQEAAKLRADAEAYSKSTREAADQYAAKTRRSIDEALTKRRKEAEREAKEIHAAAKQQAERLSSEGVQRHRVLTAETKRSEARLEQLLGVFHALTSQLEDVLGDERATASSTQGRNLEEALKPQPRGDRRV